MTDKVKQVGASMSMMVATDAIEPNPWNPNVQDDFQFQKARDSIREFGFVDPITVRVGRETGAPFRKPQIIDGEHRLKAAIAEGLSAVMVVNIGRLSDARAMVLSELLNRLGGENDPVRWAEMVDSVKAADERLISFLPYDQEDLDAMLESARIDPLAEDTDPAPAGPPASKKLYKKFSVSLPEPMMNQAKDVLRKIKALHKIDDDAGAFKMLLDLATAGMAVKRQSQVPPPPSTSATQAPAKRRRIAAG